MKDGGLALVMSLRDYFAGQALIGELACQSESMGYYGIGEDAACSCAKRCYELADAMLAEREKAKEDE